jgi:periplasmic protein CpxP/Spy
MKRILAILPVFLLLTIGISAQQPQSAETQTPQERAHASALRMKKLLTLDDQQTVQTEAVILSRIEAVDKVKADATLTPEAKEAAIQKIRDEKDAELQKIFTAEQFKRYKELKDDRTKMNNTSGGK